MNKFFLILFLLLCSKLQIFGQGQTFFVGTYTNKKARGIYKYILLSDGRVSFKGVVARTNNPTFLSITKDNKFLLAACTDNNSEKKGYIELYGLKNGTLKLINKSSSGGIHPCFVNVNENKFILSANYTDGSMALHKIISKNILSDLLDIKKFTGNSLIKDRQSSPHAHSTWFYPGQDKALAIDLGTDRIWIYDIDIKNNKFNVTNDSIYQTTAGAGPRHLDFHPNKQWAYVVNELSNTIDKINITTNKYIVEQNISCLPETDSLFGTATDAADIHLSKDGRFLYISNRGKSNTISIFAIQPNGNLNFIKTVSTLGIGPRHFALSKNDNFLLVANQYTDNIVCFRRNRQNGDLRFVYEIEAFSPVNITFENN